MKKLLTKLKNNFFNILVGTVIGWVALALIFNISALIIYTISPETWKEISYQIGQFL